MTNNCSYQLQVPVLHCSSLRAPVSCSEQVTSVEATAVIDSYISLLRKVVGSNRQEQLLVSTVLDCFEKLTREPPFLPSRFHSERGVNAGSRGRVPCLPGRPALRKLEQSWTALLSEGDVPGAGAEDGGVDSARAWVSGHVVRLRVKHVSFCWYKFGFRNHQSA